MTHGCVRIVQRNDLVIYGLAIFSTFNNKQIKINYADSIGSERVLRSKLCFYTKWLADAPATLSVAPSRL